MERQVLKVSIRGISQIPVRGFEDTYIWIKNDKSGQKKRGYVSSRINFNSSSRISWFEQQKIVRREKRDYIFPSIIDSEKALIREKRLPWSSYGISSNMMIENHKNKFVSIYSTNEHNPKNKVLFNDELWDLEWYLQDTRSSKKHPKLDLNVLPVYELGFTGRGIRIAVLDDGLEYDHGDLRNNYDPEISYNVNDGNTDPMPRYESTGMNAHGTRCAGEIAMEANNGKCGVGVAFEAYIGGIKLLDGLVNDRVEGEALGFKPEIVDIYTASWGPPDDGKSLEAPGRLAEEAIYRGINKGRNGKGSIYVWASGNGGSKYDNCGCDGYVGSIYTIAIGSASQTGRSPWYSEKCPAILATTYSSGTYQDQMIVTTDLRNTCTTKHTGTSASAPLAAGILALALQANKNLTWRDVQHLIVWTSEYGPLNENPGWSKNAAGFWYNLNFGFGLMNAYVLVKFASHWINVPEKKICEIPMEFLLDTKLIHGMIKTLRFVVNDNKCSISDGNEMNFLEHVEIEVNLEYTRRGVLEMYLVAPSGTKVQLLGPRKLDDSSEGFNKWKFMSVASWGEDPHGIWFLHIFDKIGSQKYNGKIGKLKLILHGTKSLPYYRKYGSRIYDNE
ncbi:PREDICTED: neuroendocrine convertase 1-like [Polistes canadensis]|uniref:neuroendocrine convertase 1-like n=1 Tax=Polistes canadensis TaxID=91411 RepID=UPI000718F46C|nr:PREDICTED: neuroendocrine convertase 1-like [Polistes canadensis]